MEWYWIVTIILVVILSGFLAVKFTGFRKIVYNLVVEAEKEIKGSKKGQERFKQVVEAIHDFLPKWAKLFITESKIADTIEWAVSKMKQALDTGKITL